MLQINPFLILNLMGMPQTWLCFWKLEDAVPYVCVRMAISQRNEPCILAKIPVSGMSYPCDVHGLNTQSSCSRCIVFQVPKQRQRFNGKIRLCQTDLDRSRHSGCQAISRIACQGTDIAPGPSSRAFFRIYVCSCCSVFCWKSDCLVPSHFEIDQQSNSCLRTTVTPTTQLLQALLAVVSCARH